MSIVNFKQQFKPISGKLEWINMAEEMDDLKVEIAKSNYAGMLHDTERHEKYREAINIAISSLLANGKQDIHTLDIGTGTGILAMMAAKAGSHNVTACEVFKPMADVANKIVESNKFDKIINVVNKRSTNLELKTKADVLVTEIFDTELIGEGVLPTLRDAHKRLLKNDCIVVPAKAKTYVQLIESEFLYDMRTVNKFNDIKFSEQFHSCLGLANAFETQINCLYPNKIKCLSEEVYLTEFDFQKPCLHNSQDSKTSTHKIYVTIPNDGVVHAILFWWDLILDKSGNIVLSMNPNWIAAKKNENMPLWRDHWMQAVYYLAEPMICCANDTIHLTMIYDDYSVWFHVTKTKFLTLERPRCSCTFHMTWPRERFSMLNRYAEECWTNLERHCLDLKSVSVIGDCSLLPLYLAKRFKHLFVNYFDTSCFTKSIKDLIDLNNIENIKLVEEIEDVESTLVLSDPYFSSSLLPWHHLRIVTYLSKFKKAKIIPNKAVLKGCVVSLKDLWKVRASVKTIDEFDLSHFDELISVAMEAIDVGDHGKFKCVEPFSMWEFENVILSDTTSIASIDLLSPLPDNKTFNIEFKNIRDYHTANAVILWLDFLIDDSIYFTTGFKEVSQWVSWSRQGVFFLTKKLTRNSIYGKSIYEPNDEDFMFQFFE